MSSELPQTTQRARVWLITGCSAGLGRAVAEAVLARGDRLVATGRDVRALSGLEGDRTLVHPLDVTSPQQAEATVAAAIERFGRIDVLVNNAGNGSVGAVEEVAPADLRLLMETMFFGAVALTQAVLPHLRANPGPRRGAIVQISSMGGQVASAGFGAYCAAKFALEGISESLAAEVAPLGIRTLIVEPGAFRTEFGGARMHRSEPLEAYAETVGAARDYIDGMDGTQPGDPAAAAAAILTALDAPQAPLRLALGGDAVDAIRAKHAQLRADLDRWEQLSRATAFAPARVPASH